jgi:hypothetical protein
MSNTESDDETKIEIESDNETKIEIEDIYLEHKYNTDINPEIIEDIDIEKLILVDNGEFNIINQKPRYEKESNKKNNSSLYMQYDHDRDRINLGYVPKEKLKIKNNKLCEEYKNKRNNIIKSQNIEVELKF